VVNYRRFLKIAKQGHDYVTLSKKDCLTEIDSRLDNPRRMARDFCDIKETCARAIFNRLGRHATFQYLRHIPKTDEWNHCGLLDTV